MEIGLMQAGINMIQSLEIDKKATDCIAMNPNYSGHKIITGDIKDITVKEQKRSDIIVGTYPCTKYSTIADIHGTRTGDDLYLHYFRHIALEQPEVFVSENVPGMKKFPVVMEAMTQLPGYYINTFCPVNASNWLPQDRKRLIIIGTKKPFHIFSPAATRTIRIKDILEKDPEWEMKDYYVNRIYGRGGYRDRPIIVDPDKTHLAPTCVAHYSKDQSTRMVVDKRSEHGLRPFTVREYARLQGFPDDFHFPNEPYSYRLIGNAVPPPMGKWIGEQLMRYFN